MHPKKRMRSAAVKQEDICEVSVAAARVAAAASLAGVGDAAPTSLASRVSLPATRNGPLLRACACTAQEVTVAGLKERNRHLATHLKQTQKVRWGKPFRVFFCAAL